MCLRVDGGGAHARPQSRRAGAHIKARTSLPALPLPQAQGHGAGAGTFARLLYVRLRVVGGGHQQRTLRRGYPVGFRKAGPKAGKPSFP